LLFNERGEAITWAKDVAKANNFCLVIATNGAKNKKQPELLATYLRCSRHGKSKAVYDPEKPKKKPKTIKCGCKFRIRVVQDYHVVDGKRVVRWSILTADGFGNHNHDLTLYKDGQRHYSGLDAKEKSYVRGQLKASVAPK
jgi:hypothetical protein